MCVKVIGICAQSLLIILGSIVNTIRETYVIIEEERISGLCQ
jgi:hypothetical protein